MMLENKLTERFNIKAHATPHLTNSTMKTAELKQETNENYS